MNEEQVLSEYLDGELSSDIVRLLEERLLKDSALREKMEKMKGIQTALRAEGSTPSFDAEALWTRIHVSASRKPRGIREAIREASEAWHRRIALPLPALAAMLVIFLGLGFFAIVRSGSGGVNPSQAVVAEAAPNGSPSSDEVLNIPSVQSGTPVGTDSPVPLLGSVRSSPFPGSARSQGNGSDGVALTIQVQNLRDLLGLLDGSQGIREVTIQIPQETGLQSLGEPTLLKASDLGPSPTPTPMDTSSPGAAQQ